MSERKPLIAGNWKMNLSIDESVSLVKAISAGIDDLDGVETLVSPPFTALKSVKQVIANSGIFLAAQNMHWEMEGAYTGEISGRMLKEIGCTHVILGHSERRSLFRETSETVDLKAKAAVGLGLIPIVCVGETLEEREAGHAFDVIREQLNVSLHNFVAEQISFSTTILAYEPVWAIGTGKSATPEQAQEVHQFIREWIITNFESQVANQIRILYGGSVKAQNISELMSKADIDGALVGGASLNPSSFIKIIRFKEM